MDDKQELIRQLKNRDERAAGLLVERFGPRLQVAAQLLCRNEADAQDLLSETIQRAFHSIDSFREESSLFSWLYGILLNVSRMADRKVRRSPVVYVERLPEVPADSPPVAQTFDSADLAACLAEALAKLSQEQQDVVLLRYFGELAIRDIAAALNLRDGTVKSRLYYALRLLKEILPKEMNGLGR